MSENKPRLLSPNPAIQKVLDFWFAGNQATQIRRWFSANPEFDQSIRSELGTLHAQAAAGDLAEWETSPEGCLALLILLDQCSRNLFRGSGQAFAWDAQALKLAKALCASGGDQTLPALARLFVYLPFEHSEALEDQDQAVSCLQALQAQAPSGLEGAIDSFVDYAFKHREVIQRFGRFPHRNARLGRPSSPEEMNFLSQPGSSFG
ncbi:MAG: DUF924 family protein [Candidatus Sericytochromatia bacterium]